MKATRILAIALAVALAGAAMAHGGGSGDGDGYRHGAHHGMMGSGTMGPGMMGRDMMGPGMMGSGMMGHGMIGNGMLALAGLPQAERERLRELHVEHAGERFDHMLAMGEARRALREAMQTEPLDAEAVGAAYDQVAEVRREVFLSSLRLRKAMREALPEDFREQMRERMGGYRGMGYGEGMRQGSGMGHGGMMQQR